MAENYDVANASIDKRSDVDDKPQLSKFWLGEVSAAKKRDEGWHKRADRVIARFRDERDTDRGEGAERRANILWSNTETLKAALFTGVGNPDVRRRFPKKGEDDKAARQAALSLERSLSYCADAYDLDPQLEAAVEDYLLPGRGTAWIVYDAEVSEGYEDIADDEPGKDPEAAEAEGEDNPEAYEPEITSQSVRVEHVFFKDFLTSAGRKWSDCWWVARGHDYSRDELTRYWPEHAEEIPLNISVSGYVEAKGKSANKDEADTFKRARVWEIWDKSKKQRVYVAEEYENILETEDDPYRLKDFFPTCEPLYAVKTTSSLTPIPEYTLYQDQAAELDIVQTRLSRLTSALKRRGVYDASAEDGNHPLAAMAEAGDNEFIPYRGFALLMEKGGLKNVFQTEDLTPMIAVIDKLSQREQMLLQKIYEITGISDILRGASDPNETATAQKIKGQFGSLRLQKRQKRIQVFIRDLFRLKAEIIAEHFTREQLSEMAGIDMPLKAEQEQAKMMLQAIEQQQKQQQPGPQPGPQPPHPGPGPGIQPGQGASAAMPPHAQGPMAGHNSPPAPSHLQGHGPANAGMNGVQQSQPQSQPPIDPKIIQKLIAMVRAVSWEEIAGILRSDLRRGYKVDIETDATNAIDSETEKQQRIEFLTAMSSFMEKALPGLMQAPALAPALLPLAKENAMFAVGAFKAGRTMEEAYEDGFTKLEEIAKAAAAKGPGKSPEESKLEADIKAKQAEMQFKAQESAMDRKLEEAKAAQQAKLAEQELAHKAKLAEFEAQNEARLAEMKMQQEAQLRQMEFQQDAQMKEREMAQAAQHQEREFGLKREQFDQTSQLEKRKFDHSASLEWEKHDREAMAQEPGGAAPADGASPGAGETPPATDQSAQRPRRLILSMMEESKQAQELAAQEIRQSQAQMGEMLAALQQFSALMAQQMQALAGMQEAARRPKRVIRDPRTGRATHVETGHGVFGIERGADGRAAGLSPTMQ